MKTQRETFTFKNTTRKVHKVNTDITNNELPSFLGGQKSVTLDQNDMFKWPIVTPEHESAVLEVLKAGQMSGLDVTKKFEKGFADFIGTKYALGCVNGTSAILEAMFAAGVGNGDEVICPSLTYWASIVQCYALGATPVFAEVNPKTLCIDPEDLENCISENTKAIMVTHYCGYPVEMDKVIDFAKKHNLKVIEDCSHSHGTLYKGKQTGTFGDVSAFSLMTAKSFAIGEAGILLTSNREIYERAILFGHYIRHGEIESEDLKAFAGLPCGGVKNRMHQLSSAFGMVQLKLYSGQMQDIDKAMNYFCDLLEGLPGIRTMRPEKNSGSTKGGWYYPHFEYVPEELSGLSLSTFSKAVVAEGSICNPGCNKPLHNHPLFKTMDVYGQGKPTRFANLKNIDNKTRFTRPLPITGKAVKRTFEIPWFKHFRADIIEQHAAAYKKVIQNHQALLKDDVEDEQIYGGYSSFFKENPKK